jgi:hypothetical protein
MKSFHDYHLIGYEVDGQCRELRMNLAWQYPDDPNPRPPEQIVFEGVEDYFSEHDLGVNIVSAIEEVPLLAHLEAHANKFRESSKWGWPRFWRGEIAKTVDYLNARSGRCLELSSSYGLTGWVVAAKVGKVAGAA